MTNREKIDAIRRTAKSVGGEVRKDYSGRGMFGATCYGIDCDDRFDCIVKAARRGLPVPRVDQMGKGWILYWADVRDEPDVPTVPAPAASSPLPRAGDRVTTNREERYDDCVSGEENMTLPAGSAGHVVQVVEQPDGPVIHVVYPPGAWLVYTAEEFARGTGPATPGSALYPHSQDDLDRAWHAARRAGATIAEADAVYGRMARETRSV